MGFEEALALAQAGANVILASRDQAKGEAAVVKIRGLVSNANVSFEIIDLADLSSVKDFGAKMLSKLTKLDILINNAGVMTPPKRLETKDGYELQFGTNYLSHFALTSYLLPLLKKAKGRVVSLSSVAARKGAINLADLQAKKNYQPMPVYAQSKIACLMFAIELQKRSDQNGWGITSVASHPGVSRTDLFTSSAADSRTPKLIRKYGWFLFQPVSQGALPVLYAATSQNAQPGGYYGPHAIREIRGYPAVAKVPKQAQDSQSQKKLWDLSEKLAKVSFN